MGDLITDVSQVTPDWLTGILRREGHLNQAAVSAIRTKPGPKASSTIESLEIDYTPDSSSDAPKRLILKITRPDRITGPREADFYNRIASRMTDPPTIRCYDAVHDSGRVHLLLEDLSDTHLSHPPAQLPPLAAQSELITDALADFHAQWWDHPDLANLAGDPPTTASLTEEIDHSIKTFAGFVDFLGDRLPARRRDVYERVFAALLPRLIDHLAKDNGNLTLIHGDPHIGNFLYPREAAKDRLRTLDWKSWHIDVGPNDMAHMMAVFWF